MLLQSSKYGGLPAETYLSEVDATSVDQKQLAFQRADSKAMRQVLLTKYAHTTRLEWERQKTEGIEEAYRRWQENDGRASWGCACFHKWKENDDQALQQTSPSMSTSRAELEPARLLGISLLKRSEKQQ